MVTWPVTLRGSTRDILGFPISGASKFSIISNMADRTHNKSNINTLVILSSSDDIIKTWSTTMADSLFRFDGLISGSDCLCLTAQDGRLTVNRKKVAYGYHIVAFNKFGREELKKVTTNKLQTDLVISHLCGTRNCCNPDHLILETKQTNDERTHCHFCMRNAKQSGKLAAFLACGACRHEPQCGSISK